MQIIRLGALRSSEGWRKHDEQFRLKKARTPSSSWGEIDGELWLLYIHQNTYQSQFNNARIAKAGSGKCFDFNYRGFCTRSPCYYFHTCMKCNQAHTLVQCPTNSMPLRASVSTTRFRNPSIFRAPNQQYHVRHQYNLHREQAPRPRFSTAFMGIRKFAKLR